ncbi:hypothetical protein EMIHUDRAFT_429362 [Emiliania huxleyi CCMP1516]|uniref:NAD(P)-binding domain-containing protein n=2 Tax=Emiliania huxleyi TaxID=2903 RepID=A0A0D3KEG9_EMIH1|nr:hypothetical protein EMIHUDRAFT_429362 [Emiliania huxleyi CCMP1516]EOD34154.1 hypothetical protein EMIHUDRAFT_429362 [Emiliania huxleyi CCMP1516]|eukprot:XP_005786583.1 hypothetical protein EMIHUDRAFT_429362 [Emiliania huxleyi CCMP1516]
MNHLLLLLVASSSSALKVLVTGAGGRTGKLVFQQLKESASFAPVGLVRSKKAVKALRKVGGADDAEIVRADVTDGAALAAAMAGCDSVVLCTSAVPQILPFSIAKPGRPKFKFAPGGTPEEVDWLGAKLQIDAAKAAGVKRFVFVSSMGGTQPDNFLNSIGERKSDEDGSGGDILLWKRKAERYLISSGLEYTIIHPGGLVDKPAGARELTVGVDDELLGQAFRQVPRADVARVCCAALTEPAAADLSLDLASRPEGEGAVTDSPGSLFASLGGKSCDYSTVLDDPPSIFATG